MKQLLLSGFAGLTMFSAFAQPVAYTGCPGRNVAIVRDGFNADDTNPVYLYDVNTANGTASNKVGPILNPANGTNLQLNGLGLNTTDGFLYGIQPGQVSNPAQGLTPRPFYKVGSNAVAAQFGTIVLPTLQPGENIATINAAAGGTDLADNYYFSAASGTLTIFPSATATIKTLWIGKIAGLSTLPAGTANIDVPVLTYTKLVQGANTAQYYNSLLVTATGANTSSVSNNGLRDLAYNPNDNLVYSFVTFPDPANPGSYIGQVIVVDPVSGNISSPTAPYTVPFVSSSNEVAGTLIDKNGNFLILFTDGSMYRADGDAKSGFTGTVTQLSGTGSGANPTSGLEGPSGTLRGDLASCGDILSTGPLPILLTYFNAFASGNNNVTIKWETATEINTSEFILERSFDAVNWTGVYTVAAAGNSGALADYSYNDINIPSKIVYYRLKTINIGGAADYSSIKKIALSSTAVSISYYPNPVRNIVYVESSVPLTNNLSLRLNDIAGRVYNVPFSKADINKLKVDMSALTPGVYFLQIINTDGTNSSVQKLIKQ